MKRIIGLAGALALVVVLAGCTSATTPTSPETTRSASSLDERVRYGEIDYRIRGCLTNRTDGNIDYWYQKDPRQMDGKALPDRAPEKRGTLGPGAFTCAYSPVSLEPAFFVEVVLGPQQGFDTFKIESIGGGYLGVMCSGDDVDGWKQGEMLDDGIPLNVNCGLPAEYPTTASFDGAVASVAGIPTFTVNWSVLPKP